MINKNMINCNNVERVEANVKWYNPEKGYGFLNQDDSYDDIMIHFSTLATIGCAYVKVGDRVICDTVRGKSGMQVVRVIEVKLVSQEQRSFSDFLNSHLTPLDSENLEEIKGVIKWYNTDKGYGFICPDEGTREIFLHFSVLREAGYKFVEPGVRVLAKVSPSERGPEARMIRVLHTEKQEVV